MIVNRKIYQYPAAVKIVIAGGVTGGHLFPGIAIAQEFISKDRDNRVLFISSGNALEQSMLAETGFNLRTISVQGIKGRGIRNQVLSVLLLPKGLLASFRHLIRFKPDLVISVGSYSAGPVAIAAWLLGMKMVLHEQNILPGITNRILSRFADRVYLSFGNGATGLNPKKIRYSGNPVRKEILTGESEQKDSKITDAKSKRPFTVLITGGSQGAHNINLSVIDSLRHIKQKGDYWFVHQTGSQDEEMVKIAYDRHGIKGTVQPFFKDMAEQYHKADLVICRSGATTVAEITAAGKAAILIPFPYAADNHQVLNARSLANVGAAEMILEPYLNGKLLARRIEHYASSSDMLRQMAQNANKLGKPNAAKFIVEDCYQLLRGSS